MKKPLCVLLIILLAIPLPGCGQIKKEISSYKERSASASQTDGNLPGDRDGASWDDDWDDSLPDFGDGVDSGPKLADAPVYEFGDGQFAVFDGEQKVEELSSIVFLEFYSHYINLKGGYDSHEMHEAIEHASGGQLFGLLSSPIINAEDYNVVRRAAVVDGKQYPWTVLFIQLIYPDTVLGGGYEENEAGNKEDVVTVFANCDGFFIEDGYREVIVTGRWDDGMKLMTGYVLEEGDTSFLASFD